VTDDNRRIQSAGAPDRVTLDAYDRGATAFANDWENQPAASDLHEAIVGNFKPGPTADIGCGSGRDTAWLNANGFPAVGYDASESLLAEARRRHPGIQFLCASLPDLVGIALGSFTNVLCETVIMHLDSGAIPGAVARLLDIVAPHGILILSWRVTEKADLRDEHGRLYSAFDASMVLTSLRSTQVLSDRQLHSASSGKIVRRVIAQKVIEQSEGPNR
jgi:SAM-dependent methyltransferase